MLFLLLSTAIVLLIYLYKSRFEVFKGRVPYIPFDLKTLWNYGREHPSAHVQNAYNYIKPKAPIGGLFLGLSPFLVVTDLELAKNILIKEFNTFMNRGIYYNPKDDPVGASLFVIEGEAWRSKRRELTKTLTSGKIKAMLPVVLEKCKELNKVMLESSKDLNWDLKNVLCRFTADVIGIVSFGLDCDGLMDPNNEFVQFGLATFRVIRPLTMAALAKFEFTALARLLKMRRLTKPIANFYTSIVNQTILYREQHNIVREDMIGSLIKMKNSNLLSVNEIVSSSYSFFAAGLETTANTLNYVFYNLAIYPVLQERVREEVRRVLREHNQKLTYEAVSAMPLVEKVLLESLRRYTSAGFLFRIAVADYKVPNTDFVIRKGERILIPVQAMQLDSTIYPNALQFNIERDYTSLLSFGLGPRMCIAERFAMVEMKVLLANFLNEYKVLASAGTPTALTFANKVNTLATEQKLTLGIERLE